MTAAATELRCRRCLDRYSEHDPDGHCQAVKGEHEPVPCPCTGFLWVDPEGPPVGSYREPPQRP